MQSFRNHLGRLWTHDQGVLSFEWILLITLVVIGVIGGLTAVRDAVVDELGDVAEAAINIDQSWTVEAPACCPDAEHLSGSYEDTGPNTIQRQRSGGNGSQPPCEPGQRPRRGN